MSELIKRGERQLTLPGFRARPSGLVANKGLTREQWEDAGHTLFQIEGRLSWYLGDWLSACKCEAWGYGDLAELCEQMGWNYGTTRNYMSVCEAFELSRRRENLSFTHHKEAQGPDQDDLLQWAADNNASKAELRQEKKRRRELAPVVDEKGKFRVIYADPPWRYNDERGKRVDGGSAAAQYNTLSIKQLSEMNIAELAAENAVLFLWVTVPLLAEAMPVIDSWGFKYKTHIVWDKTRPLYGHYSHVRHEILCICTKGSCTPAEGVDLPHSVIAINRTKHSAKPHEFYEMIERMYPTGKKIELFARTARKGWKAWGNESPKHLKNNTR